MRVNYFGKFYRIKRFLVSLLFYMLLIGCNETLEPIDSEFGYEYYPTEMGDYRIYHTSDIRYNLNGTIDTTQYLVKELVEELIENVDGTFRLTLGRYSADIGSNDWSKDSLWAVFMDETKVVVSEANVDFIKLVFPVTESTEWNGNAFNSSDDEIYRVEEMRENYSYDTLSFENTLTVVHKDLIDPAKLTTDEYRVEVFAAGIGLIHKLKIKIKYCSNCVENGKIENGFIFEQKLIEFGKE